MEDRKQEVQELEAEQLESVSGGANVVIGPKLKFVCPCGAEFNTDKALKEHREHCGYGKVR